MRQAMGKNNLKLSTKGFFFLTTAQKPHGRGVFPFSFFCVGSSFISGVELARLTPIFIYLADPSCRQGLHITTVLLTVSLLIIFAQYSILQVQKEGRASNTQKRCLLLKRIIQKNSNSELIKPHIFSTEVF